MNLDLVRPFERAVNADDVEAAVGLVTEDVEVDGPRGSSSGLDVFRRWVASSGISDRAVLRTGECGRRRAAGQLGRKSPEVRTVATVFGARDGRICRVVRYDDGADAALAAAGLSHTDELPV